MEIRKLRSDEVELFREIRVEMCKLHPEAFGPTPEEVLANSSEKMTDLAAPRDTFPQSFILGAFEKGKLIGTVAFRRDEAQKERHRAWIWAVYVRPEHRGRGISKKLMIAAIDAARNIDGLEALVLEVGAPQTGARTLYTALGFHTFGTHYGVFKLGDGRYVDHEAMVLWLKGD